MSIAPRCTNASRTAQSTGTYTESTHRSLADDTIIYCTYRRPQARAWGQPGQAPEGRQRASSSIKEGCANMSDGGSACRNLFQTCAGRFFNTTPSLRCRYCARTYTLSRKAQTRVRLPPKQAGKESNRVGSQEAPHSPHSQVVVVVFLSHFCNIVYT